MKTSKIKDVERVAQSMHDSGKKITASTLVAACAKDEDARRAFEWDNTKAANLYRLNQANTYLRKIRIVVEDASEPQQMVSVHVQTVDEGEGEYLPTSVIVKDDELFDIAVLNATKRLMEARHALDRLTSAAQKAGKVKAAKHYGKIGDALVKLQHDLHPDS